MVSFAVGTNFKYPNKKQKYKSIHFFTERKCFGNKYYVRFKYIDWRYKKIKTDTYRFKKKKDFKNYKNKIYKLYYK